MSSSGATSTSVLSETKKSGQEKGLDWIINCLKAAIRSYPENGRSSDDYNNFLIVCKLCNDIASEQILGEEKATLAIDRFKKIVDIIKNEFCVGMQRNIQYWHVLNVSLAKYHRFRLFGLILRSIDQHFPKMINPHVSWVVSHIHPGWIKRTNGTKKVMYTPLVKILDLSHISLEVYTYKAKGIKQRLEQLIPEQRTAEYCESDFNKIRQDLVIALEFYISMDTSKHRSDCWQLFEIINIVSHYRKQRRMEELNREFLIIEEKEEKNDLVIAKKKLSARSRYDMQCEMLFFCIQKIFSDEAKKHKMYAEYLAYDSAHHFYRILGLYLQSIMQKYPSLNNSSICKVINKIVVPDDKSYKDFVSEINLLPPKVMNDLYQSRKTDEFVKREFCRVAPMTMHLFWQGMPSLNDISSINDSIYWKYEPDDAQFDTKSVPPPISI